MIHLNWARYIIRFIICLSCSRAFLRPLLCGENGYTAFTLEELDELKEHGQIPIPGPRKKALKMQLDRVGINYFSLFPDLDGLGRQIKWEIDSDYR
jgi:hypothetical protein